MFNPSHPGAILRDIMDDDITVSALAKHACVTRTNLSLILNERAGISPMMSPKLDEAFGKSEGLQVQYD